MKKICLCLLLTAALTISASALGVPTSTVVQNLNGSQQEVKAYTVSPEVDAQTLIEEPFHLKGFLYTYADIVKEENRVAERQTHTETVTVETAKKNLDMGLCSNQKESAKEREPMKKRIWCALLCAVLALSLAVPSLAAYRDVPAGHWAAGDIQYVTERGLFKGTGGDTFGPSTEMSRAMLATVLYRYAGSPAVWETVPYSDVTVGAWYAPGVAWAYQNRIFPSANLERSLLYPSENVRRAEFCVMLYRFAQSLGKADADPSAVNRAPFTDMEWNRFSMAGFGPLYNEAAEAMLGWAWPIGIMEGTSATTINPLGTITRAEVAAMLARFDRNVLGGTEPTVQPSPDPTPDPSPDPTDNGYTTADGKPLTEENVRAAIVALKEIYPDGTVYPTPYCSNNPPNRPYSNCNHCAGWDMLCSDAAFGDLLWRYRDNPSWDEIQVGDVVEYDTAQSGHVIVVIDKTDEYIKVTESGTHNKALWGGQYFKW